MADTLSPMAMPTLKTIGSVDSMEDLVSKRKGHHSHTYRSSINPGTRSGSTAGTCSTSTSAITVLPDQNKAEEQVVYEQGGWRLHPNFLKNKKLSRHACESMLVYQEEGLGPANEVKITMEEMKIRHMKQSGLTMFHDTHINDSVDNKQSREEIDKSFSLDGSMTSSYNSFLGKREKTKRPARGIGKLFPVILYLVNDIMNGSFVLLPYVMGFNGWIGGLLIIWGLGLLNYYCCNLLFRTAKIFPGAVTFGDLCYYLTRSKSGMVISFILAYGLIFMTNTLQLSMAANCFQFAVFRDFCYNVCKPIWLAFMVVILVPLSQLRNLKSVFYINLGNLICILTFWAISMGSTIYDNIVEDHEITNKLFAHPNDLQISTSTDLASLTVGFPLAGITVVYQMYYYQIIVLEIMAEMERPKDFPKANKIATAFILTIYTLTALVMYATFRSEYLDQYSFRKSLIIFLTPVDSTWLGQLGAFLFGSGLTGSALIRTVILTRALHLFANPKHANTRCWQSAGEWFGFSLLILLLGGLAAIAIPDVHLLSSINGALGILVCILLPCLFFLFARWRGQRTVKITRLESFFLYTIVAGAVTALVFYVIIMVYQNKDIIAKVHSHNIESPVWQVPQCTAMFETGIHRNTSTLFLSTC